jgi:hypothetical protein
VNLGRDSKCIIALARWCDLIRAEGDMELMNISSESGLFDLLLHSFSINHWEVEEWICLLITLYPTSNNGICFTPLPHTYIQNLDMTVLVSMSILFTIA